MKTFLIATMSIVLSVAAQFLLRQGMSDPAVRSELTNGWSAQSIIAVVFNPYIVLGFLLYGVGAAVWLSVLAKWDVSKAYPLVGAGFLMSCVLGAVLGEAVSLQRVLGCVVISAGVLLVSQS